jgi:hypothetical protein
MAFPANRRDNIAQRHTLPPVVSSDFLSKLVSFNKQGTPQRASNTHHGGYPLANPPLPHLTIAPVRVLTRPPSQGPKSRPVISVLLLSSSPLPACRFDGPGVRTPPTNDAMAGSLRAERAGPPRQGIPAPGRRRRRWPILAAVGHLLAQGRGVFLGQNRPAASSRFDERHLPGGGLSKKRKVYRWALQVRGVTKGPEPLLAIIGVRLVGGCAIIPRHGFLMMTWCVWVRCYRIRKGWTT